MWTPFLITGSVLGDQKLKNSENVSEEHVTDSRNVLLYLHIFLILVVENCGETLKGFVRLVSQNSKQICETSLPRVQNGFEILVFQGYTVQ